LGVWVVFKPLKEVIKAKPTSISTRFHGTFQASLAGRGIKGEALRLQRRQGFFKFSLEYQ
jgi:hypothetical protein